MGTIEGEGQLLGNLTRPKHGLVDPPGYDFSLTSGAAAIDRGVEFEYRPKYESVHPTHAARGNKSGVSTWVPLSDAGYRL